jgi:hypothetical protein
MFSLELEAVQVLGAAHALKRGHLRIGADASVSRTRPRISWNSCSRSGARWASAASA